MGLGVHNESPFTICLKINGNETLSTIIKAVNTNDAIIRDAISNYAPI